MTKHHDSVFDSEKNSLKQTEIFNFHVIITIVKKNILFNFVSDQ